MRFRAEVSNHGILTRLIQSIDKLSRKCILRLTPERVHFICAGEDATGVQVWSQVQVDAIFQAYHVESKSANEIHLEILIEALQRALKSATGATEIILKLSKKGRSPILAFHIRNASRTGKQLDVIQEVGIKVLKPDEVRALKEPLCPDPDVHKSIAEVICPKGIGQVHIILPPLLSLKTVIDRMKTISGDVTFSANLSGEMRLRVENDTANVTTEWRDLRHPELDPTATQQENANAAVDTHAFHSVTLDMRGIIKFLSSHVIAGTVIACICANHCGIFYVYVGDPTSRAATGGVLTYFVPACKREGDN